MALHEFRPHQRVATRHRDGIPTVAGQHPTGSAVARFNTRVALLITKAVGSMWCAYAFAGFDCISLPAAIRVGTAAIVVWIAQTFLQLVLLSVIMVGQNVQAAAADARAEATWLDVEAILHGQAQLAEHLARQDAVLIGLQGKLGSAAQPAQQ